LEVNKKNVFVFCILILNTLGKMFSTNWFLKNETFRLKFYCLIPNPSPLTLKLFCDEGRGDIESRLYVGILVIYTVHCTANTTCVVCTVHCTELVLLNLYGAQESMPRPQFRQPM
jgi:hypothetical protein